MPRRKSSKRTPTRRSLPKKRLRPRKVTPPWKRRPRDEPIPWDEAVQFHEQRPVTERVLDEQEDATITLPYPTKKWMEDPNRYDVQGIDTRDSSPQSREVLSDVFDLLTKLQELREQGITKYYHDDPETKKRIPMRIGKFQFLDKGVQFYAFIHDNGRFVVKIPRGNVEPRIMRQWFKEMMTAYDRLRPLGIVPITYYLPRENILIQEFVPPYQLMTVDDEIALESILEKLNIRAADLHQGNAYIAMYKKTTPMIIDLGSFRAFKKEPSIKDVEEVRKKLKESFGDDFDLHPEPVSEEWLYDELERMEDKILSIMVGMPPREKTRAKPHEDFMDFINKVNGHDASLHSRTESPEWIDKVGAPSSLTTSEVERALENLFDDWNVPEEKKHDLIRKVISSSRSKTTQNTDEWLQELFSTMESVKKINDEKQRKKSKLS